MSYMDLLPTIRVVTLTLQVQGWKIINIFPCHVYFVPLHDD
jgi:hypothetical protein